ncbi:MAG: hypothetical protein IKI40_08575, partial [Treponema sp.]|nr:hypothetical protein [Treponema sp.]
KEERDQERALQLEREIRDYNLILKSMDYAIQEVQKEREYIQYKRENNFYKQALKELYIEACKAKRSYSTTYITRKEQCITIIK